MAQGKFPRPATKTLSFLLNEQLHLVKFGPLASASSSVQWG